MLYTWYKGRVAEFLIFSKVSIYDFLTLNILYIPTLKYNGFFNRKIPLLKKLKYAIIIYWDITLLITSSIKMALISISFVLFSNYEHFAGYFASSDNKCLCRFIISSRSLLIKDFRSKKSLMLNNWCINMQQQYETKSGQIIQSGSAQPTLYAPESILTKHLVLIGIKTPFIPPLCFIATSCDSRR